MAVNSLVWPSRLEAVDPPSETLSFKGTIPSLTSIVRTAAIRSDGRYLFYSAGDTNFLSLDLQDMVRTSTALALPGSIVGVFLSSDTRAIVVTTKGVSFVDLTKPMKPKLETASYKKPESETAYTVTDACIMTDKSVAIFEKHTERNHQVRVVAGVNAANPVAWGLGADSGKTPLAIRCMGNSWVMTALDSASYTTAERLYLSNSSGQTATIDRRPNYKYADFSVSEKQDQIFILMNRKTALGNQEDSEVRILNSSLASGGDFSIGSLARVVASFKDGESASKFGFFVGQDRLASASNPPTHKLLLGPLPFAAPPSANDARGTGSESIGLSGRPSIWLSTTKDHYKYGITDSTGMALIGSGPKIDVVRAPSNTRITSEQPLSFTIKSDRDATYQLRIDQDLSTDGTSQGLKREPGNLIRQGNLRKNEETALEVSSSELAISKEGTHSLMVMAYDTSLASNSAPLSRLGFSFSYDPPPSALANLRLGFGDQAVYVFFDEPTTGDIAQYVVHYSFDPNDLLTLDDEPRSFASGIGEATLTSPLTVTPAQFGGRIILGPFANGRTMYVRAYAVDKTGQVGTPSDILSRTAYRTLTVPEALGGPDSCALRARSRTNGAENVNQLLWLLFLGVSWLVWRFESSGREKKIGPSTSRNRRGGD